MASANAWFSTKRPGKDDDAIEKDKAKALELRKARLARNRKTTKSAADKKKKPLAKTKPKQSSRRRLSTSSSESGHSGSMDDFIVEDEDDEKEELSKESSSEDEELMMGLGRDRKPPPRNRSLPGGNNKQINSQVSQAIALNGDIDSSSDEDLSLMPAFAKRTSKPAPHMARLNSRQASASKKPALALKLNQFAKFSASSLPSVPSNPSKHSSTSSNVKASLDEDNDTGFLGNTVTSLEDDEHDTIDEGLPVKKKNSMTAFTDDDDDDDIVAVQASKKRRILALDDEASPPRPRIRTTSLASELMDSDNDDQVALALAMSESLAQPPKEKKSKEKGDHSDEDQETQFVEFEDESESDSEGDQGDTSQDYSGGDKDARTAASVLEAANRLSAQVLKTMQDWGASSNDGIPAVTGMIVDGAVSLANVSSASVGHDWISEETMEKICPAVKLAPYQLIGINWMALLHGMTVPVEDEKKRTKRTNVNGVLADEMGLGKTCQTIAFLAWLRHQRESREGHLPAKCGIEKKTHTVDRADSESDEDDDDLDSAVGEGSDKNVGNEGYVAPHLVVAPASVLSNWAREFEKFAPHLNVVKYHGTMAERKILQEDLRLHLPKNAASRKHTGAAPIDVILTPVTYFQKEQSDDRSFLRKFRYNYMVVDEAHLLKNSKGLRYTSLDSFQSEYRLLLTGTPVQNSPQELMSLLCFLMPLFSRKTNGFDNDRKNDGGESMLQHFVSLEDTNDDAAAYRKLKHLFAPFVLRRRKQDVLSQIMPPKERRVEFVELDAASRKVYNDILSDHLNSRQKGKSRTDHAFTQLRKAAHHPLLLRTRHTSQSEKDNLVKLFLQYGFFRGDGSSLVRVHQEVAKMNDFDIHLAACELIEENPMRREALAPYILDAEDLFSSPKCVRLRALLPELIENGHRVLIFSGWTNCLDLLTCLLDQMDLSYLRMQGSTPVTERQDLIDKFTNDTSIPVFLLSTRACGLGINLTSADTCIMHDIDFNPFNDLQAEDRVHRIGQKKTTTVIKLVTAETVDADIYEMQQRKARMNAAIMDNNGSSNDEDWTKNAKATQEMVLKTAMNRFLSQAQGAEQRGKTEEAIQIDSSSEEEISKPCRINSKLRRTTSPDKEDI